MKFKGTIVITDPCYVMRDQQGAPQLTKDDWDACDYGSNMEVLGITNYITENTIYGDWSCTTYATENPQKIVDDLAEIAKYFNDKYEEYGGYKVITEEQYKTLCEECDTKQDALNVKVENIGHFCADAGLVSVFLLDEVLAYNPDFLKFVEEHSHCATIIKDFDGDVEYYVDEAGDAHIIGTGSTNFFTTQTGL